MKSFFLLTILYVAQAVTHKNILSLHGIGSEKPLNGTIPHHYWKMILPKLDKFNHIKNNSKADKYDNVLWLNRKLPKPSRINGTAQKPLWRTITQKLDNFNEYSQKTWEMRYLENDQFDRGNGPIFIMLGGESEIDPGWLQSGQMFDIAANTKAIMYYLEHRYYGNSKPSFSLSMNDLPFLTIRQALADYAYFITNLKKNETFSKRKVIVFGASYAGNLAMWMRQKYPYLVNGAVVSSAPLNIKVDFKEYLEIVTNILNHSDCIEVIGNGLKGIQTHLITGLTGIEIVQKDFNLCQIFNPFNFYDEAFFFMTIAGEFSKIIQNSKRDEIDKICRELTFGRSKNHTLVNDYNRLSNFIRKARNNECMENYDDFIFSLSSYYSQGGHRQWLFQICNELGFFQSSSSTFQPFYNYFPIDLSYQMCTDIFGYSTGTEHIQNNVMRIHNEYKGLNLQEVTNVITVYGSNDPWSALGLKTSPNKNSAVIIVRGGFHCEDLFSISSTDSTEMQNAKNSVKQFVEKLVM